mmetsp:Transcript_5067/g.16487  ORF Transcript_5067/g.16487 Transcript_5067/m.16487 type:complete len:286 (-) Transcript_5067:292-1149(-)
MIPWRLVQTTLFCHNASRCGGCAGDDRIQSPREGRGGWLARGVAVRIQEWREQRLRRHRPVCRHRRHQPAEQLPRLAVEREGALPRVGQRVCGGGVDAPRGEVVPLVSQREPQRVQALLREGGQGEPEPEEAGRVDVVREGLPHGEQLLGRAVEHLSTSRQRVVQSVITQQRLSSGRRSTEHGTLPASRPRCTTQPATSHADPKSISASVRPLVSTSRLCGLTSLCTTPSEWMWARASRTSCSVRRGSSDATQPSAAVSSTRPSSPRSRYSPSVASPHRSHTRCS